VDKHRGKKFVFGKRASGRNARRSPSGPWPSGGRARNGKSPACPGS